MFREAAFNIIKLNRQNEFPMEIIVYPLLCNGNPALLEKYVARQPELQMRLMKIVEQLHIDNSLNRSIVRVRKCFLFSKKIFDSGRETVVRPVRKLCLSKFSCLKKTFREKTFQI